MAVIVAFLFSHKGQPSWDGVWYLAIAQGRYHAVEYYYARRILHPLIARLLTHLFTLTWSDAFYSLACVSLVLYLAAVEIYVLSASEVAFALLTLPLLITPALLAAFRDIYCHYLFFSALLAAFFLALRFNPWMSLPLLLLLNLTRESALILDIAIVFVAAGRGAYRFAGAAGLVGAIGLTVAARWIPVPLGNSHHMSALIFYPLKVLYDISQNVFGLVFWTNTIGALLRSCAPRYVLHLPRWPHLLGTVSEIGLCRFDPRIPLLNALGLATVFGATPAVLGWAAVRRRIDTARIDSAVALAYGLAAFVLSLLIGTDVSRYAADAFPAFWLVGLIALYQTTKGRPRLAARLAVLSFGVSWLPIVLSKGPVGNYEPLPGASLARMLIALALTAALYRLALKWLEDGSRTAIRESR